jgi:prepilin-type N-terminal cleavage/methylation domain-containing protein
LDCGSPLPLSSAFTVIELLVVIAIIGALTAISLPAIKGISQSHTANSASRQLLDDLGLARQYAIHNRAVVHVLFVPPGITNPAAMTFPLGQDLPKRLMAGIYSTYAIYAERTVGDQPGQPRARYLSKWKSLPEGIFIAPREFTDLDFKDWDAVNNPLGRPLLWDTRTKFSFPTLTNTAIQLPHIAFNPNGGITIEDDRGERQSPRDEVIELARGSILAARDANGNLSYFDVRESPPNNSVNNYIRIRIDGLTGRGKLERPEL